MANSAVLQKKNKLKSRRKIGRLAIVVVMWNDVSCFGVLIMNKLKIFLLYFKLTFHIHFAPETKSVKWSVFWSLLDLQGLDHLLGWGKVMLLKQKQNHKKLLLGKKFLWICKKIKCKIFDCEKFLCVTECNQFLTCIIQNSKQYSWICIVDEHVFINIIQVINSRSTYVSTLCIYCPVEDTFRIH